MHAPSCRFCRAPLSHRFVDLGTSPLCSASEDALDCSEEFFPPARPPIRALLARPVRRVPKPPAHLLGIRVLLILRACAGGFGGRALRGLGGAARTQAPQPADRGREQRWLPAAALHPTAHPGSGHRVGRERGRPREGQRRGHAGALLRHPDGARSRRAGGSGPHIHYLVDEIETGTDTGAGQGPRDPSGLPAHPAVELVDEVVRHTSSIRDWGGQWVVPIPYLRVLS
jgi:hypothetical protein